MKERNKKSRKNIKENLKLTTLGFTLVELLAVIVILAIILVIAVPKIMDTIKDATKASLESSAKMVASQVENQYTVAQTLGKEFGNTGSCMEEWAGLNETDYASCRYKITSSGEAKVTIGGKGKFNGLSVCDATRNSATAIEGECADNNGVSYIEDLLEEAAEENGLILDDTDDQNIRYVGANPSNKVYFNCKDTYDGKSYGSEGYDYASACETWRIIGVFNVKTNISDTKGTKRIKIVRDAFTNSEGNELNMSWDSSGENINGGSGINQWGVSGSYEGADLMQLLNGYYLGATSTCTYCYGWNQSTCSYSCNDSITPLSTTTQNMIGQAVWSTRGISWDQIEDGTASEIYSLEQTSELTGKICSSTNSDGSINNDCNDSVERTIEWEGKIGLIYPSDWGYASTDPNCSNILDLSETCIQSNWLYNKDSWYWTISPMANSYDPSRILGAFTNVCSREAYLGDGDWGAMVRPTTYLKSDIKIIGGNGGSEPFKLAI